jgi:hypothetical protein
LFPPQSFAEASSFCRVQSPSFPPHCQHSKCFFF